MRVILLFLVALIVVSLAVSVLLWVWFDLDGSYFYLPRR